jgi:hypothetical protein
MFCRKRPDRARTAHCRESEKNPQYFSQSFLPLSVGPS